MTRDRPRHAFGLNPLEQAIEKAKENPVILKALDGKLTSLIASIALELQLVQGDRPIILPVEQLRRLLHQRKLLVGGALKQLVKQQILDEVDPLYGPRKAREYRFIAKEGVDFERVRNRE
jgi:hypothetical protein